MYRKDHLLLEEAYQKIKESYSQLCLEGAAEDMVTSHLTKLEAPNDIIQFFLQKEAGKLIFKPEHVSTLYSWLKDKNADQRTLIDDYKAYQKFFQAKPLDQFSSYLDWTEKVHAKRDESEYQSRHKEVKEIDISNEDKENVLANDEDVLILKGDDEHKCVRYGKGYSFCISRGGGGNMYGNYRLDKGSTFYFIYFKKVPKTDERHIMVLDRTKNGWEWTFGNNETRRVQGEWNEILASFPVLAKYKNKFVNKPLSKEEEGYQKKLKEFVATPNSEKFKEFSYKEKADVLKFGVLLPLDLFESLDKYLRNEWVSVGPKMSNNIYNLLNDKEKERFIIVRKQQLTQRDPTDKWDIEICKNDSQLFEKYIKQDKELCDTQEKEIQSKIVDGVCKEDIKITCKYFFPNLDNLKECGDIDANAIAVNVSLPQLQQCKGITTNSAASLNLPQLQQCGHIYASSVNKLSLPQLKQSGYIVVTSAASISLPVLQQCKGIDTKLITNLDLPQLEHLSGPFDVRFADSVSLPRLTTSEAMYVMSVTSLSLPQLKECGGIWAHSAASVSLPHMQYCYEFQANSVTSLSLPQLKETKGPIEAKSATSVSLPRLQTSGPIRMGSAKKIIINKSLIDKLITKNSVKIIDPSELNDSIESQQIKAESFKGFFNRLLKLV